MISGTLWAPADAGKTNKEEYNMRKDAKTIAVVGAGMMASGMATLCCGHGYKTVVLCRSEESIRRCAGTVDMHFRQMSEHGLLSPAQIDICKSYLTFTMDDADLKDAFAAYECITENLEQKHSVYRRLEAACPSLEMICSVTSSIVPEKLAEYGGKYADRIVVTHPFNPVHLAPYFEICQGEITREGIAQAARELLEKLDKKPIILKKTTPGFVGNRLQFALFREALALVEEGIADPRDVDTCLNYSFCPRYTSIGIFEHFDNGDLRLCKTVSDGLFPVISDAKAAPALLNDKIARGDYGAKTGVGFYDWRDVDMDAYQDRVGAPYWKFGHWAFPEE